MKEAQLRKLVRQEIISKLDKITEGEDPFVPTYGKGDVVHDCPKHVQEIITGKKGKVMGHTLTESGDVNFVDVDFGTGKIFENIPTKKLKILEMQEHYHEIKEEPITGAGEDEMVTETGEKCDCAAVHPGISHRAYDSQQLTEATILANVYYIDSEGSAVPEHELAGRSKGGPNFLYIKKGTKGIYDKREGEFESEEGSNVYINKRYIKEDLKVKAKKDNEQGSSLGYKLTEPQHKKMLALLKKNKSNADVKQLLATLKDKYSDSVSITLDNRPFFVYAQYGQLRIGSGGKVSQWNDNMKTALTKYIGEGYKANPINLLEAYRSNIVKKWDSTKVMMDDLRQFILQAKDAGGVDLSRDIADALKLMSNYAMGEYKKAKRVGEGKSPKSKSRLTEAFASTKLGQVFGKVNKYTSEKKFLSQMAKSYGLEWDKITDDQVKGPDTKLDRKGIDLIIATQDVNLARTSTYDWTTYIKKGQLLGATIKGKRVWAGRVGISTGAGKNRSFVGLDKRGYSNVKSVLSITGAVVYHIDPELKSRGAKDKVASRAEAKAGATALMKARDVKDSNKKAYQAALRVKAGQEGKGALIKMIEQATKMYEKVLKEKLDMLKKGMVSTERWNNDSWSTVSRAHQQMIRDFQYWMREAADQEAQAKKDGPNGSRGGADYMQKSMNNYALNIKTEFNTMNSALKKIDKSKEYSKIEGRAY